MKFGQSRVRLLLGLLLLMCIHFFVNVIHLTYFIFRIIFISFVDVVTVFVSVSTIPFVVSIVPPSTIAIVTHSVVVGSIVASSFLIALTFVTN